MYAVGSNIDDNMTLPSSTARLIQSLHSWLITPTQLELSHSTPCARLSANSTTPVPIMVLDRARARHGHNDGLLVINLQKFQQIQFPGLERSNCNHMR